MSEKFEYPIRITGNKIRELLYVARARMKNVCVCCAWWWKYLGNFATKMHIDEIYAIRLYSLRMKIKAVSAMPHKNIWVVVVVVCVYIEHVIFTATKWQIKMFIAFLWNFKSSIISCAFYTRSWIKYLRIYDDESKYICKLTQLCASFVYIFISLWKHFLFGYADRRILRIVYTQKHTKICTYKCGFYCAPRMYLSLFIKLP